MHTFFHGWRRKAGVVTLLIACFVMGMWVRNRVIEDSLVYFTQDEILGLIARKSGLSWTRYTPWIPEGLIRPAGYREFTHDVPRQTSHDRYEGYVVVWRWQWQGFDFGERQEEHYARRLVDWTIPHWSLVIPLTLLSAYLILWKPRKRGHEHKTKYDAFFWWSVLVAVLLYPIIAIFLPIYVILQLLRLGPKPPQWTDDTDLPPPSPD